MLSGRLRSVLSSGGGEAMKKKQMVDEYTKGDMVGLVDVVTATNRYGKINFELK